MSMDNHTSNNVLSHYHNKDFKSLANCNLNQTINVDGDTVIHLMAKNLDLFGIELLVRYNPKNIRDAINVKNKNFQTPIDKALESNDYNTNTSKFINLMVENGANISNNKKLQNMNNNIMNNIKNLRNQEKSKSENYLVDDDNKDIQFIKELTEYYANQAGGRHNGMRKIKGYYAHSDSFSETGKNDSFIPNSKDKILKKYDNNFSDNSENSSVDINSSKFDKLFTSEKPDWDKDSESSFSDNLTNQMRPRNRKSDEMYRSFIQKIMDELNVDETTARLYRYAIKITLQNKYREENTRKSDLEKVEEMQSIIGNKDKLKKFIDKVNMKDIQKRMEEQQEKWKKINQEKEKTRDQKNVKKEPKVETSISEEKSDDKSRSTKPRAKKIAKKPVAESGYLLSNDEILFSPDD